MRPRIVVAAGILIDKDDRVLLAERSAGSEHVPGYWEFPGGKCESGEAVFAALCRELDEELGIKVTAAKRFMQLKHAYSERDVVLHFWRVMTWRGEPRSKEGQAIKWAKRAKLHDQNILPADEPVIARLISGSVSG